jgi:tRNA pseudouridine55 synthase
LQPFKKPFFDVILRPPRLWVPCFVPTPLPIDIDGGGVLLVHKPIAYTSFKIVKSIEIALRKKYNLKKIKVGHAGTLDPLATGLLIICYGKYTKQIDSYQAQQKTYCGTMLLGQTTPSHDLETPPDAHYPTDHLTPAILHAAADSFVGNSTQVPPVYSAIKIDGVPLYKHARAGNTIDAPTARPITITQFGITRHDPQTHEIDFEIQCSKGTYIRSLVYDFGQKIHSGATMIELCRTAIGTHHLQNAWQIDDLLHFIENQT